MTLRLLPGSRPGDAARALREQEMALTNIRSVGHSSQDLLREYLGWAITSERMLRNHFSGDSVSQVVLTQRYWALQTSGYGNWETVRFLVEAEIREQSERLLREKALLDAARFRWAWGVLLVLDTSAIIHGPELWEWSPADELDLHGRSIQLVVPILVLDELDDLKESTKQHTRNRARRTLRWIGDALGSENHVVIRGGTGAARSDGSDAGGDVHLDILLDEPGHVRLPVADDEIVDRAATVASQSGREVTLVTNDVGQAYRARLAGLTAVTVAEPLYDIDVREAARETEKAQKMQELADKRASQERRRGKRKEQDSL